VTCAIVRQLLSLTDSNISMTSRLSLGQEHCKALFQSTPLQISSSQRYRRLMIAYVKDGAFRPASTRFLCIQPSQEFRCCHSHQWRHSSNSLEVGISVCFSLRHYSCASFSLRRQWQFDSRHLSRSLEFVLQVTVLRSSGFETSIL
jgi:hypothetical protein